VTILYIIYKMFLNKPFNNIINYIYFIYKLVFYNLKLINSYNKNKVIKLSFIFFKVINYNKNTLR
jgi:hypothetical protein